MIYQYSHTYRRPQTEAQIQQSAADQAEANALAAQQQAEGQGAQFYRETLPDGSDEILTYCPACARQRREAGDQLEHIDRAGDWDACGDCGLQNIGVS